MTTDKLVREALEAARCSVPRGGVTDCHGYKCRQSNCLACCGEDAYEHSDTLEKIDAALASLSAQPETLISPITGRPMPVVGRLSPASPECGSCGGLGKAPDRVVRRRLVRGDPCPACAAKPGEE